MRPQDKTQVLENVMCYTYFIYLIPILYIIYNLYISPGGCARLTFRSPSVFS